ncbi:AraC family transcriptional regulator [Wenjunlia tyrosinilytica]|uniref:Transcriptional regulator n=1 Tax=Wenjunlia tyrosinilytica TaxID=1544741 RepID=A0A917ZTP5_9ACTN|nr:AraC family transcriptional regulator [Wenjunlia tyrosinilytica]GGO90192.1 transcriptional regulator [Wenjunlia tyrosinilytica]
MSALGNGGQAVGSSGHSAVVGGLLPPVRPFPRGIATVRAMVEVAGEHGVPLARCLANSGLSEAAVTDEGAHVRAGQELIVAHNLVRAMGDPPGLGLEVGRRIRLRTYSVWGFALLASPTLGDAAAVGLRYLELTFAVVGIHLQHGPGEVHLVLDDACVPRSIRRFLIEREIAVIRTILDSILGEPFTPLRVDLRFARPRSSTPYEALAGTPIVFGAPRNAFVADAALLDRPLPQADHHTMRVCERECRVLLARRAETGSAGRVADLLARWPEGIPAMGAAASALHMSTRTLHRRLSAEGTSYRRLVDEARHARAVDMLTTAGLGVEQIAARLGYADGAAFVRAFRRWTGATPGAYRVGLPGGG